MQFNSKRFQKAKFVARVAEVPVPDLRPFFDDLPADQVPKWRVRGLTGSELGYVNETAQRNRNITAILEGIIAPESHEKIQSIRALLGMTKDTPDDVARRLELFVIGSKDPEIDMETAVKLCRTFPIEFYQLTNKITELTGQGHVPGELQGSGEIPASEQP